MFRHGYARILWSLFCLCISAEAFLTINSLQKAAIKLRAHAMCQSRSASLGLARTFRMDDEMARQGIKTDMTVHRWACHEFRPSFFELAQNTYFKPEGSMQDNPSFTGIMSSKQPHESIIHTFAEHVQLSKMWITSSFWSHVILDVFSRGGETNRKLPYTLLETKYIQLITSDKIFGDESAGAFEFGLLTVTKTSTSMHVTVANYVPIFHHRMLLSERSETWR